MINRILYTEKTVALLPDGEDLFNSFKVIEEDLITELEEHLRNGVVKFMYAKEDGSLREAYGTTKPDMLPRKKEQVLAEEYGMLAFTGELTHEKKSELNASFKKLQEKAVRDYTGNSEWVNYYDFNSGAWRKFAKSKLVCIMP